MANGSFGLKECETCGKVFMKKARNQRYCCPKCRGENMEVRERKRDRERARYFSKKKEALDEEIRKRSKPDLAQIENAARAAGMSYGRYIAAKRMKERVGA